MSDPSTIETYELADGKVKIRIGYPDGHVELDIKAPFPIGTIHKSIDFGTIEKLQKIVDRAVAWAKGKVKKVGP